MAVVTDFLNGWKQILKFGGKTTRIEFINWIGGNVTIALASVVISNVIESIPMAMLRALAEDALETIMLVWFFVFVVAQFSITLRRLDDAGYNKLWILLTIIPLGPLLVLFMVLSPTKQD